MAIFGLKCVRFLFSFWTSPFYPHSQISIYIIWFRFWHFKTNSTFKVSPPSFSTHHPHGIFLCSFYQSSHLDFCQPLYYINELLRHWLGWFSILKTESVSHRTKWASPYIRRRDVHGMRHSGRMFFIKLCSVLICDRSHESMVHLEGE